MKTRLAFVLLAAVLCPAGAPAETRVIGVRVVKRPDATVRVSISSDEAAENKNGLKVEEAAAILRAAKGWGSSVEVGIRAHGVPLQGYLPILKAISENVWLRLAFVEGTAPNFIHDNIRRRMHREEAGEPAPKRGKGGPAGAKSQGPPSAGNAGGEFQIQSR